MVKLYNIISLDGYVSDKQQHLIWPKQADKQNPLDSQQFKDFFAGIDYILISEQTFMDTYSNWPYADKHVIVFASKEIILKHERKVTYVYTDPIEYCKLNSIVNAWLVGGTKLVNQFLNTGLIKEVHLVQIPVLIGEGTQLFRVTQEISFKCEEVSQLGENIYIKLVK